MNEPDKLEEFMEKFCNGEKVKVFDIYYESVLNYRHYRFSGEFINKVKELLWEDSKSLAEISE
jgi:hypothetical protein